jgi:hypothetical protein
MNKPMDLLELLRRRREQLGFVTPGPLIDHVSGWQSSSTLPEDEANVRRYCPTFFNQLENGKFVGKKMIDARVKLIARAYKLKIPELKQALEIGTTDPEAICINELPFSWEDHWKKLIHMSDELPPGLTDALGREMTLKLCQALSRVDKALKFPFDDDLKKQVIKSFLRANSLEHLISSPPA